MADQKPLAFSVLIDGEQRIEVAGEQLELPVFGEQFQDMAVELAGIMKRSMPDSTVQVVSWIADETSSPSRLGEQSHYILTEREDALRAFEATQEQARRIASRS